MTASTGAQRRLVLPLIPVQLIGFTGKIPYTALRGLSDEKLPFEGRHRVSDDFECPDIRARHGRPR